MGLCSNNQIILIMLMKLSLASFLLVFAVGFSIQAAEVSVTISKVHLCCKGCVNGVERAVGEVQGVKVAVDQDEGTVALTAADRATVQKGADALVAAGYFGRSSDATIKIDSGGHGKGKKVQSLEVKGVHLCCKKCVSAVSEALGEVAGVKGNTAAKGAESFTVTGDFNDAEVFSALHKAGLAGRAK